MKRIIEKNDSPLTTLLEWLVTLVIVVWLIRIMLCYLYRHRLIVIAVIAISLAGFIAYRVYDYKRRSRY